MFSFRQNLPHVTFHVIFHFCVAHFSHSSEFALFSFCCLVPPACNSAFCFIFRALVVYDVYVKCPGVLMAVLHSFCRPNCHHSVAGGDNVSHILSQSCSLSLQLLKSQVCGSTLWDHLSINRLPRRSHKKKE